MQWVPVPARQPQRCCLLPTIAGFHPKGFIQGTELFGGDTAYVSIEAVEQVARSMGWAPDAERVRQMEKIRAERDEARAQIKELEQAVVALRALPPAAVAASPQRRRRREEAVS